MSAAAYAQALMGGTETPYGKVQGLEAELVTVNPLLGRDSLSRSSLKLARAGAGVLALVRTSNPGAVDIQERELADGRAVWEWIATLVDELGAAGVGNAGLSDVGAVVAATAPGHLARARELMPNATFLLPGVGAQGGRVEDLGAAFAPGKAGGLVTASRSIVNAHQAQRGRPRGCGARRGAALAGGGLAARSKVERR